MVFSRNIAIVGVLAIVLPGVAVAVMAERHRLAALPITLMSVPGGGPEVTHVRGNVIRALFVLRREKSLVALDGDLIVSICSRVGAEEVELARVEATVTTSDFHRTTLGNPIVLLPSTRELAFDREFTLAPSVDMPASAVPAHLYVAYLRFTPKGGKPAAREVPSSLQGFDGPLGPPISFWVQAPIPASGPQR